MPSSVTWGAEGGNLTVAVNNGSLEDTRLSDMAIRIVASWYQMGQDDVRPLPRPAPLSPSEPTASLT